MKRSTSVLLGAIAMVGTASAAIVANMSDDYAGPVELTIGTKATPAIDGWFSASPAVAAEAGVQSDWAKIVNGKLAYQATPEGDRIMDFSTAGYAGGGVALPTGEPVRITLSPSGGDDTAAIQNAINTVSARDRGSDRYRGVVKLNAGTFKISSTININATGVILAGAGSGSTMVEMTGTTGFLAIKIGASQAPVLSNTVNLTQSYVPSGTASINVSSTSGFSVGQRVQVSRVATGAWVNYVGMGNLVRDGAPQTWIAPGAVFATPRAIKSINTSTKQITFDAPLTDSFDSAYLGSTVGTLSAAEYPGRLSWVGVEKLTIKAPTGTKVYQALTMNNVINGYLLDVIGRETQNAFNVGTDAQQITFNLVKNINSTSQTAGAPTADFAINGSQVLLNKCETQGRGTWTLVTQAMGVGPIVLLNFKSNGNKGIGPHQRWFTGLLVDSSTTTGGSSQDPGLAFTNRINLGSGHGWTTAWSVAWNVTAPYFKVQQAPGTKNWCIGCVGSRVSASPSGTYSSPDAAVEPASLYLQQLYERKGTSALNAIGYSSTSPTS